MGIPLLLHGRHVPPLHGLVGGHAGPGVTYQPFGPWIVPWRFSSTDTEYRALTTGVGLIDYSHHALLEIQGTDRISFLHNLLSNDLTHLAAGHGCRAALLTPNAKLIAELLVLVDPASVWLVCEMTRAATVAHTLERYHFAEDVTLINHERRTAVLALQGPHTLTLLKRLFGASTVLPHPGDHLTQSLEGLSVRLVHHSLTHAVGVLCLVSAEETFAFWQLVQQRGASLGLTLVGWDALNIARLEAGIPWFGVDMDESNLLPETGLETTLASETKGCYVGQEIVARMAAYGSVNKQLMGLRLEGRQVPDAGDRIVRQDEEVGRVTSACRSLTLGEPIALGFLKRGTYNPDTSVHIVHGTVRLPATVTKFPFVTP